MTSAVERLPSPLGELSDSRFRLRRLDFPRIRPRNAPRGYIDGIGWFSEGLLWIDGWLTLAPSDRLEVSFEISKAVVRREAYCLVRPTMAEDSRSIGRHWILLVPVGDGFETASRVRKVTARTEAGDLLWLGGYDRFISPEIGYRLYNPAFPASLRACLESFIEEVIGKEGGRLDDPLLRRNLETLYRSRVRDKEPRRKVLSRRDGEDERRVEEIGVPPDEPGMSIVLTLLDQPDLLNDHFLYLSRSHPSCDFELVLVLGLANQTDGTFQQVGRLADLYGLPGRVLFLNREVSWPTAVRLGAEKARGEILVVIQGHTLTFERESLDALREPLFEDERVGITAPKVHYFDGLTRSTGFQVDKFQANGNFRVRAAGLPEIGGESRSRSIDGCSADCFAVRRHLLELLNGLSGRFLYEDFETLDLCLRGAAAGYSAARVETSVTRLVEEGTHRPITEIRGLVDRHDRWLLAQRHSGCSPAGGARGTHAKEVSNGGGSSPESRGDEGSGPKARPDEAPEVSIVIPTFEPGEELEEVLERIESQEGAVSLETFVIDSSSRDGTAEVLKRRNVRHRIIAKESFNHGLTRNLGVQEARGEIVVFLSQDALPGPGWLRGLLEAFRDRDVAGAYSRQIPRQGASPFVRDQLARWPATSSKPRLQEMSARGTFHTLTLEDKLSTICFDNVSSAVRRSVALEIPFRRLSFGEDRDWAYRALAAGYSIHYCPTSTVIHSHERPLWYELRRTVADHRSIRELLLPDAPAELEPVLPAARQEFLRLLDVASRASSRTMRLRARSEVPIRCLVGPVAGRLASRSVHLASAGSRLWTRLGSWLTGGV